MAPDERGFARRDPPIDEREETPRLDGASIPSTCVSSIGAQRAIRWVAKCTASSTTVSLAPASFNSRAAD